MAVTATDSTEIANATASPVVLNYSSDVGGKVRISMFHATQGAAAGDATSTLELCRLNRGRVRVLSKLSNVAWSAMGTARVMAIGTRAYTKNDGTTNAEDSSALDSAVDVAAAGSAAVGVALTLEKSIVWTSRTGIVLFATITGGTIPIAATLSGWVAYTNEA